LFMMKMNPDRKSDHNDAAGVSYTPDPVA